VFLGPLFGVLVDRYDKKRLLQLSSLCRALIVPALIFTQSADTLPLMFVITFFKFVFSSLYVPARSAIVPFIVPKEDLVIANGLDGVIFSCMHFIGGAFGGLMTTFLGITGAFIADSVCFFVTVRISLSLSLSRVVLNRPDRSTLDVRDGVPVQHGKRMASALYGPRSSRQVVRLLWWCRWVIGCTKVQSRRVVG